MNGHDELIELLGVYALDAVSPDERRAIEAHLEICPACRAEVAEHIEVAAGLSALSVAPPPADLFERIRRSLDDGSTTTDLQPGPTPPLRMLTTPEPVEQGPDVAAPSVPSDDASPTAVDVALPASLDDRRARSGRLARRPASTRVGALLAVAAVIVAMLGIGLVQVVRHNQQLDQQLAQPAIELAADRARIDPASRQLPLKAADGTVGAVAVITPTGDGYLIPQQLEALPADRTYQLWEIGSAGPVSIGVLGNEPAVTGFHVQGPVGTVAITKEASGGVPAPTGTPVLATTA